MIDYYAEHVAPQLKIVAPAGPEWGMIFTVTDKPVKCG
jgi:hypothetical protein